MQLARTLEAITVSQSVGRVVAVEPDGERFAVILPEGRVLARRAPSCLLMAEPGDRVLVATTLEECYVLAVLEREGADRARLVIQGDAQLSARDGKLTMSGEQGVELVTPKVVSVVSRGLEVHATEGNVVLGRLKTIVGSVDAVLERLSQKVKRVYRFVEELEHVRAGTLDYAARETVRLHGKNAIVTSQELVKVDGEQIHMG